MDENRKENPECSILDTERQKWYVFTYMWILAVKLMMTKLNPQTHRGYIYRESKVPKRSRIERCGWKERCWNGRSKWGRGAERGLEEGIQEETAKIKGH